MPEYGLRGTAYKLSYWYKTNIGYARALPIEDKLEILYNVWFHFGGAFPVQMFCFDLYIDFSTAIKYVTKKMLQENGIEYTPSDPVVERVTTDYEIEQFAKDAKVQKPSYELALFLSLGKDEVIRRWKEMRDEMRVEGA
jgi:hypothetical protein